MTRSRGKRCHAVVQYERSHQIERVQLCQNAGTHLVGATRLCGTHFNAAARGPIETLGSFELDDADIVVHDDPVTGHRIAGG